MQNFLSQSWLGQRNLAIENAEFPQSVLAGHFQRKILNIIQQLATENFKIHKPFSNKLIICFIGNMHNLHFYYTCQSLPSLPILYIVKAN